MRDIMWIYGAIILFSEAWSQTTGPNQSPFTNSSTTSGPPKVYVVRNLTFNVGSEVDLKCSNKTWSETMFVIWKINVKSKECRISFSNDGRSEDTCDDGKSLRNTSRSQSYLHIPKFSNGDVGIYKCESVYTGGNEDYDINVAITAPPSVSAWFEHKDNKMVAVCQAERGNPAANISWSHSGNSSSVEMLLESHGYFTVESRLEIPERMDTESLSCVISHPYWEEDKILVPKPQKGYILWLYFLIVVAIIVFLAGVLFCSQKKLIILRRCQQSDTAPSKSPPTEDVEEVEPYASYVQRVNSIYNSSADLFT